MCAEANSNGSKNSRNNWLGSGHSDTPSVLSTKGVKRILNPFFLAMEAGSPAPENMRHIPQG